MPSLSPVAQKFILHWGEMGTRWGVNRTVAQVHALLFLSRRPLHAEEIAKTLSVARSNVSTSLHFESMKDVWEMFRIILAERKRREIDPTLRVLQECVAELERGSADAYTRQRLLDMLEFLGTMNGLYEEVRRISPGAMRSLAKLRGGLRKLAGK